jgi:two-component system, cell cycle response regulator
MPHHTVLLVDGDVDARTIFRTVLEHRGYRVIEATDPEEALRIARTVRPSLVIQEHPLHFRDGTTFAQALKADPETACILILTITAHVMKPELAAAWLDHSARVLTKPILPGAVARNVDELIGCCHA